MYTQCPQCDSVYRVTGAHLKQAGGEVVCGECGARFDALDRLSDVYPQPGQPAIPLSPDEPQPEGLIDDPTAADATAEDSGQVVEPAGTTDLAADDEAVPDEGAGSPEDGGIETADTETAGTSDDSADAEAEEAKSDESAARDGVAADDEESESEAPERAEDESVAERQETQQADASETDDEEPTVNLDSTAEELFALEELPPQQMPEIDDLEFAEGLPVGEFSADAVDSEAQDSGPPPELARQAEAEGRSRLRPWLIGLVVAVLLATGVHSQRGVLMRYPALSPILENLYSALGMSASPAWQIAAFRIVDSSASLDAAGDLQIAVQFVNEGDFPQPYPTLRVSLENRWGDEIGSRELSPRYYVENHVSGRQSLPGERIDGRAVISEPGLAAVGFRLDLCLQDETDQPRCLSEQP